MAVETAADLASLFDENEFAEAAVYLASAPGSLDAPCTVIVDRGQGRALFEAGEAKASGSQRHLWVRRADLETVVRGASFTMLDADGLETGEVFTVQGLPVLDHTGRLWSVDILIAS